MEEESNEEVIEVNYDYEFNYFNLYHKGEFITSKNSEHSMNTGKKEKYIKKLFSFAEIALAVAK